MATITLSSNKINQMPGLIKDVKKSVNSYKSELFTLKSKALTINNSVCNMDDVISSIQSSSQTQEQKADSLDNLSQNIEEFVSDVVRIDGNVADTVNKRKDDFYDEFSYLKPECEKSGWEKFKDGCKKVAEWCKEHWKLIVTIVIVAVAIVVLCFIPGGGILAGMIAGACWGAISGAVIGGIAGGIASVKKGGSFWGGAENGAFNSAIGGAIGGAITGGFTVALGPATTLLQGIGRGAGLGALSSGVSNMAVTGLDYFIQFGTLEGSLDEILIGGFSGAIFGGTVGGIMGGIQFKLNQFKVNKNEYGQQDIADYEYNMIEDSGPLAETDGNPAKNFFGGRYNVEVLAEDKIFYRAGNSTNPMGQYFTSEPPTSVAQVRIDTAVKPQWINPVTGVCEGTSIIDTVYAIKFPQGTTVYTGPVGSQGGVYCGGSNIIQKFIEKPWDLPGVEVINKLVLK